MRRNFFFRAVLIVSACLVAFGAAWAKEPKGLLVRAEQILDPQMNNAVAATVALPGGWKLAEKQVTWNFNTYLDLAHVLFQLNSEADDAGFFMISPMKFIMNNTGGNLGYAPKQPVSAEALAREWLDMLYSKRTSGFRVKRVTQPQYVLESLNAAIPKVRQRYASSVYNVKSITSDAAQVEFMFTADGHVWEGVAVLGAIYSSVSTNDGRINFVNWETTPFIVLGAQEGRAEAYSNDVAVIIGNSSINPAWRETVDQLQSLLQQRALEKSELDKLASDAALRQQLQDTHNYITRTQREVFNNRQASMSNVNRGWSNTVAGVDTWSGGGESYSAPAGYNYAWRSSNGNTYYTNDSTFNPNHSSNFSGDWSQMEKTPW